MEVRLEVLAQRLADADKTVFAPRRRTPRSAPTALRRELRCSDSGFGAIVVHPLERCPTCGCGDWQLIGALSASTGAEVAHS